MNATVYNLKTASIEWHDSEIVLMRSRKRSVEKRGITPKIGQKMGHTYRLILEIKVKVNWVKKT